ncbi:MAG: SpoIID/LytB domain-containing protein [Flavobacteriales bacterium]|nr:SpoIID/LytB domain-containing protein [Flavobacteriales bacterium]
MKCIRSLSIVLGLSATLFAAAQDNTVMRAGLFRDKAMKEVLVMSQRGASEVFVDGVRKGELMTTDGLKINVVNGKVQARSLAFSFASAERIELRPHGGKGLLRITGVQPKVAERTYSGSITLSVVAGDLLLVNEVAIEDYVAGVVQSEAGKDKAPGVLQAASGELSHLCVGEQAQAHP